MEFKDTLPGIMWADVFEPDHIVDPLERVIPVVVESINSQGYADYAWKDIKKHIKQWERKQIAEALSDLDGLEEQLNRELITCDELTLVVENPYLATPDGIQTYQYHMDKTGKVWFVPGHRFTKQPNLIGRWEGLKAGLRMAGVDVIEVPHMSVTVQALAAAFNSSMKEEHTTFRRYLRVHIPPMSPNIHVENLMRIKGANLGPVRAQKAVAEYGTFYRVVTADIRRLYTLWGKGVAENFFKIVRGE